MTIVNIYHKPQLLNNYSPPPLLESLVYAEVIIYLTSLHVMTNKPLLTYTRGTKEVGPLQQHEIQSCLWLDNVVQYSNHCALIYANEINFDTA
jgi:hypothetical protein